MKHLLLTLFSLLTWISINGQCEPPTPEIVGDLFGCGGDTLRIRVDSFDVNNTYTWDIDDDLTFFTAPINDFVIIQLPDSSDGVFSVSLTETLPGGTVCSNTVFANLTIEEGHTLVCDDNLNVSLSENCELNLTADVILEGQLYPNESYRLEARSNGRIVTGDLSRYVGWPLKVSVFHDCSGNSCWGNILIEDKEAPVIDCPADTIVSCFNEDTFPLPDASDNCDGSVVVEEISNVLDVSECLDDYSAIRTITYGVEDEYGNVGANCVFTVFYQFENIDSVQFPPNLGALDDDSYLSCDNQPRWDLNNNFYPDIEETGYPTLFGNDIMESNALCKINATYSDQRIDVCDKTFKVIREWVILDWCTGKIVTGSQIIKVLDDEGPDVTCPPDSIFNSNTRPYECLSNFVVPPPVVIFDCSDEITYNVAYLLADEDGEAPEDTIYITDNVRGNSEDGYVIDDLPLGRTWLRYQVFDGCGNRTDCFTEVDVIDNIPPIPVCDQNTVVGLTDLDFGEVFAKTFDDGSYDNCGIVKYEVARMRSGCGENTAFDESVIVCCDDIGEETMVQFRVTDAAGNSNTCMVNVTVQDKGRPVITCPDDTTIECKDVFDIGDVGGEATAVDNCPGVRVELTRIDTSLNRCYVGTVRFFYRATDNSDNTATCTQTVRIVDNTTFTESDIFWRTSVPDVDRDGCMVGDTDPSSTGYPEWRDDECRQVTATYDDELFNIVDSVCFKILRTWTVIDWCSYDQNDNTGIYTYVQVIKLNNSIAPTFDNCRDQEICVTGPGCEGDIDLLVTATDDCPNNVNLNYDFEIDYDGDGSINRTGNSFDLSGVYPVGNHTVFVTVADGCGNERDCEFDLNVKDCKAPTPYCLSEIVTVVMPSTDMIDIWASDFDKESFDNCPGELKFSFSLNTSDTQRIFDCDSIGFRSLRVYVTDEAGNADFCEVRVDIQPGSDACGGMRRVGGQVIASDNNTMSEVTLTAEDINGQVVKQAITDDSGNYTFFGLPNSSDLRVSASSNIDPMNGVSTLDLVLIQRHILGISPLDSPIKIIAADVSNNGRITAADLVSLRKLILGITEEFESNDSWRFVSEDHDFDDPSVPFPFEEKVEVNGNSINTDLNFIGIKIGDVNESAVVNLRSTVSEPRSNEALELLYNDQDFESNDIIKVDILSGKNQSIVGMQGTFSFDAEGLEFLGVESGELQLDDANLNINRVAEGMLAMSWHEMSEVALSDRDVVFSLFFKAITGGELNEQLNTTSSIVKSEAYDNNLNVMDVELRSIDTKEVPQLTVFQNNPNPFSASTAIGFEITKESPVNLKIFDMSGKLLYKQAKTYEAGRHNIHVYSDDLGGSGILTYTIETNFGTVTKKMVVVK